MQEQKGQDAGPSRFPPIDYLGTGRPTDEDVSTACDFEGVVMRVFPLRANAYRLASFVDRYLNQDIPPEIAHFRPALPYVLLMIVNYGRMTSPANTIGWVSQNEVLFGVPLYGNWLENGRRVSDFSMVAPFIFVDNALSAAAGREVLGWPKLTGWLEPGVNRWMKNPLGPRCLMSLRTTTISDLYSGHKAEPQELLSIEKTVPQQIGQIPPSLSYLMEPFVQGPRAMLEVLSSAPDWLSLARPVAREASGTLIGMVRQLFLSLLGGRGDLFGNTVNPKQIRASDGDHACYQSLVNARMKIRRFNEGGILGNVEVLRGDPTGGFSIHLNDLEGIPIIESLGLYTHGRPASRAGGQARLKPLLPFWLSVDVRYEDSHRLCWRGSGPNGTSRWQPWLSSSNEGALHELEPHAFHPEIPADRGESALQLAFSWMSGQLEPRVGELWNKYRKKELIQEGNADAQPRDPGLPLYNTSLGPIVTSIQGPFRFRRVKTTVLPLPAYSQALRKILPSMPLRSPATLSGFPFMTPVDFGPIVPAEGRTLFAPAIFEEWLAQRDSFEEWLAEKGWQKQGAGAESQGLAEASRAALLEKLRQANETHDRMERQCHSLGLSRWSTDFPPLPTSLVFLMITEYGEVSSPENDVGSWVGREVALVVPVTNSLQVHDELPQHTFLYWPYVFSDSTTAVWTGREVLGLPSVNAKIGPSIGEYMPRVDDERPLLQVGVIDFQGISQEGQLKTLMEIQARPTRRGNIRLKGGSLVADQLSATGLRELDLTNLPRGQAEVVVPSISLKEFQDEELPYRPCFQSLVMVNRRLKDMTIRPLQGDYTVRIRRSKTLPIARSLGLASVSEANGSGTYDKVTALDPFVLECDMDVDNPVDIVSRSLDGKWQKAPFESHIQLAEATSRSARQTNGTLGEILRQFTAPQPDDEPLPTGVFHGFDEAGGRLTITLEVEGSQQAPSWKTDSDVIPIVRAKALPPKAKEPVCTVRFNGGPAMQLVPEGRPHWDPERRVFRTVCGARITYRKEEDLDRVKVVVEQGANRWVAVHDSGKADAPSKRRSDSSKATRAG